MQKYFCYVCAGTKLCLNALGQRQIVNLFSFFFFGGGVSLGSVYNTIVPFPVPGNTDF